MGNKKFPFGQQLTQAFLIVLLLVFDIGCAQHSGQASPSQAQKSSPAKVQLNQDDMGTSNDTAQLSKELADRFKVRTENRVYRRGMERRSDLPGYKRIQQDVFVKAERSIKLEELVKTVEAVEDAGAKPVALPITVSEAKARNIKANTVKLCSVCALSERGRDGDTRPNPLVLLVRLRQVDSIPPESSPGVASIDDFVMSDGIPISLSGAGSGESSMVITIPRDGEYRLGEQRIEKAALETTIRDLIKVKPATERIVFIKAGSDINYGSLEDIYFAAFAAGSNGIHLDKGERIITWEEQDMKLTVPSGWHTGWNRFPSVVSKDESLSLQGPDGSKLVVEVLDDRWVKEADPTGETALNEEYELQFAQQKKGEIDEVRYLDLDGAKGLLSRSTLVEDNERSISLRWQGFRRHKGKRQYVSIGVEGRVTGSSDRQELDSILNILSSIKLLKN